ncbi:hypothetical protein T492DRAFT_947210 [Pavlovales sp. CCMP2436]|nr:hypothetical protein T492DRAFT_947210 [Pavlovales sp. CCMP2436]
MSKWKEHYCVLPAFRKKISPGLVVDNIKILSISSMGREVRFTWPSYTPGDDSVAILLDEYGSFECTIEAHKADAGTRNGAAETIRFTLLRIALEPTNLTSTILRSKHEKIFALPTFFTGGEVDVNELPLFKRSVSDFNSISEGYTFTIFPAGKPKLTGAIKIEPYLVRYDLVEPGKSRTSFYVLALADATHPEFLHLFASSVKMYLERETLVTYLKKHKGLADYMITGEERRVAVEAFLTATLQSEELRKDETEKVTLPGYRPLSRTVSSTPTVISYEIEGEESGSELDAGADAGAAGAGAAGAGVDGNNGNGPSAPSSALSLDGAALKSRICETTRSMSQFVAAMKQKAAYCSSHKRKLDEQSKSGNVHDRDWRQSIVQAINDTDVIEANAAIPQTIATSARALAAVLGDLELLNAGAGAGAAVAGADGNNGDGPSAQFSAPFLEGAALESQICETTSAVSQFVAAMKQKAAYCSSHKRKLDEQLKSGYVNDRDLRRSIVQALNDTDAIEANVAIPETIATSARALAAVLGDLELLQTR